MHHSSIYVCTLCLLCPKSRTNHSAFRLMWSSDTGFVCSDRTNTGCVAKPKDLINNGSSRNITVAVLVGPELTGAESSLKSECSFSQRKIARLFMELCLQESAICLYPDSVESSLHFTTPAFKSHWCTNVYQHTGISFWLEYFDLESIK